MSSPIRVLHVDDDPDFLRLVAEYVERQREDLQVRTETDPTAVLPRLDDERIDCVVSDYQMPRLDGLELLGRVRERDPEVPFVLFTGRGSEAVASRAISAGVTDYLQKGGTETYELLANRVVKAVERYRARRETERIQAGYRRVADAVEDPIVSVDGSGRILYANPGVERVLGYDPGELEGQPIAEYFHDAPPLADGDGHPRADGRDRGSGTDLPSFGTRCRHADGHEVPVEVQYTTMEVGDRVVHSGILRERDGTGE